MKKLNTLALGTLLVPVLTFGASAAIAQQTGAGDTEYRSATEKEHMGSRDHMGEKTGKYLSSKPVDALRADDIIGTDLRSGVADDDVGSVSDLLIDRDGQVVAVIADVGGFLGMGTKTVAIPWDSIQRTLDEDGDEYRFTVNATEEALRDAPEYQAD